MNSNKINNPHTNHTAPKTEDIFRPEGETLHDSEEIKRLFMEGSKLGKNIKKREEQLKQIKEILNGLSMDHSFMDIKEKIIKMYKIYESGNALEKRMEYLENVKRKDSILSIAYNYVASKMENLDKLKQDFENQITGV